MKPRCTDDDFIRIFEENGPSETARILEMAERKVYERRANIEAKLGRKISAPDMRLRHNVRRDPKPVGPQRLHREVENGIVISGSDAHYWPGAATTAHRAFVKFIRDMKPAGVVKNGDELDGATISRHPPINWEKQPSLAQEIEVTQERLGEIEKAAGKAWRVWNLGNHDARFETRLATEAPEFAEIHGMHLKDHFPLWEPAYSCWVNNDVVFKHRFRGGIHATHNNTVWAGKTMVTGHLHSAQVRPFTDYNGTRFGVDLGTMATPYGPQFQYCEDNPVNWRSAFGVFTFWKGRLLWPELVHVIDEDAGLVEFRGQVIEV